MKKQTKGESGDLAIRSSSKMSNLCKDTAWAIANFYKAEMYPLTEMELKPFLKQIKKEFKKIFKEAK